MISYNVTVEKDTVTPSIDRLIEVLGQGPLTEAVGRTVSNATKRHFGYLAGFRHRGVSNRNYYGQAASGVHFSVEGDFVAIATNQVGINLHRYGGTVYPGASQTSLGASTMYGPRKATKFLTIPIRGTEAEGKRASEFGELMVVLGKGRVPFALARVVERAALTNRDGMRSVKEAGELLFRLVRSATIKADPSVLPDPDILHETVGRALKRTITVYAQSGMMADEDYSI
jgi:hypothetical protein